MQEMDFNMIHDKKTKLNSSGRIGGFSLIELLISMSIIATALVFLIGVFTTGMRANRKSVDLTAGVLVAESIISQELYGILQDDTKREVFFNNSTSSTTVPYVQGVRYNNNTKFTYKMFVSNVDSIGEGTDNAMKKIDVQVWWWNNEEATTEEEKSFRAGYGIVSVGLTRLVNQQSKL